MKWRSYACGDRGCKETLPLYILLKFRWSKTALKNKLYYYKIKA
jgi:hypothetical protein